MKHFLRLFIAISALFSLSGCDIGCDNELVASAASPSGAAKVVVFRRNCGATTGFNTQVSIAKAGFAQPSGAGNALILDGNVPLKVRWLSESNLLITGIGSARVFKRARSVDGVSVTYGQ